MTFTDNRKIMRKPFKQRVGNGFKPFPTILSLLALLAAAVLMPSPVLAAPGDLDTAFSGDGIVTLNLSCNIDRANAIAVDATGIYVAGQYYTENFGCGGGGSSAWEIVKINSTNGNYIWLQNSDPTTNNDIPYGMAVDSSGVYTVGHDYGTLGGTGWRIEKRRLDNGNLCTAANCGTQFGSNGVVRNDPSVNYDYANAIAVDSTGIYVAGRDEDPTCPAFLSTCNTRWRIEKRDLATGALIPGFGSGGILTIDPTSSISDMETEEITAIAIDATGIYATGVQFLSWDGFTLNRQWRIEKRDLNTGGQLWAAISNPSGFDENPYAIAVDSTGVYIAGWAIYPALGNAQLWRVEKRSLTTGAVINSFGSNGVVTVDFRPLYGRATALTVDSTGLYVAGWDSTDSSKQWRIQKRELANGNQTWETTSNPAVGFICNGCDDSPKSLAVDSTGLYIAGIHTGFASGFQNDQWRIEKRVLSTPPPPPTVNLSAFPATINSGESSTLSWTSTDATSCAAVSPAGWTSSTATNGAEVVWPVTTTTYTISCTGAGGTTQQSTTVTVNAPCVPGWATTIVDTAGGQNTSIAIGTDGLPVISYFDGSNGDLKVAKCGNAGCTLGNTLSTVESAGITGYYTSLAIGADGLPVIFYYDWTNSKFKVAKCGNAGCTSGNTIAIIAPQPPFGFYNSIALGADGLPVISCDTYASRVLNVIKCGNADCTSGNTLTTVDSTGVVGYYNSIAIGADSLPVISYLDSTNSSLKVVKCGNAACGSGNTFTLVDSTGSAGAYTAVAIGTDGLPVISYTDWVGKDLKVAKCGDLACTSGNSSATVDSASSADLYTAIAVGNNGLPVIAYFDGNPNYNLKVAKCGNYNCTSGNTLTTVDSAGIVGSEVSIAIGTDGLPVIAYYDQTNTDLKVAKEDNCSGVPPPSITLNANPSTINSGEYSDLTWSSSNAVSCAAVSPAGWTSQTGTSGTERLYPASTTIYIISCTGAGGTSQQATAVTVNAAPAGNDCGLRVYDGTATVTLDCENPATTTSLRVYKGGTTYGIKLVDPTDPNASRLRIGVPDGAGGTIIKALRRQ